MVIVLGAFAGKDECPTTDPHLSNIIEKSTYFLVYLLCVTTLMNYRLRHRYLNIDRLNNVIELSISIKEYIYVLISQNNAIMQHKVYANYVTMSIKVALRDVK